MPGDDCPVKDSGAGVSPSESALTLEIGGSSKPGQCVVQVVIPGDFLRLSAGESLRLWSLAVGVGKYEQALPVVRCTNVGCS